MHIDDELLKFITRIGMHAYVVDNPNNKRPITYCYLVKDNKIAYCQVGHMRNMLCTVHKPCTDYGTGFEISSTLDNITNINFDYIPGYVYTDKRIDKVRRYKSWEEFQELDKMFKYIKVGV